MHFSSDTRQSMKTSDSDLNFSRSLYPDVVSVIGCVVLAPRVANYDLLTIVYLKSPREKTNSFCLHKTEF